VVLRHETGITTIHKTKFFSLKAVASVIFWQLQLGQPTFYFQERGRPENGNGHNPPPPKRTFFLHQVPIIPGSIC